MREIKFRGLCDNGIMRYGRLSQDKENSTVYYKTHSQRICWDDSNIPVSNISLGQYTGLKDKNGVEIYEGDVVTDNATTFKIEWYKGRFDFKRIKGCYQQPYFGDNCSRMEIIGSIHQNPELCNQ